ncbi:hypothetical protein IU449_16605 [Nocardia higoensis]|uniref:Outer membrane channel protein CpnT-like N-terminal domain-containing protein n=1 Tax=Nocardia higoensis TaxID=228599 RepID=A0ABS0DCH8_9NOCA|nr:hypothetical protein [Nocardia higoensis]MBF6356141.1 hypothetical protein [Nocardia higoensis]
MALPFPGWAEPIEWLVGADWPHGNEDLMREMGRDLDDVAQDIRALIPDLDGIISGLKEIYPEGSGGEKIVAWMQPLRDSADGDHGSLEKFAANYELLSRSADSMGDQLEAAKLNFYISFAWVLAELALAAMSGPAGWLSTTVIYGTARAAFRVIANTLFGRIAAIIARIAGGRISEALVKRVLMEGLQEALVETLQGTSQELLVQTIQKQSGNIDGYDWDAVRKNAAVSAVAGGAGGLTGGLAGLRFDTRMGGMQGALNGALVGGLGGLGGAVAAGLVTGEFDPRSLTGGIFSGAGPGAIRGLRGSGTVAVNLDRMPTAPTVDGAVPTVEPITADDPAAAGTGPGQAGDTDASAKTPQSTHPAGSTGDAGNSPTDSPQAGDPSAARSTESEPVNNAPPAADTRRDGDVQESDARESSEESGAPRDTTGTTQATDSPNSAGTTQSTGDTGPADRAGQDRPNTVDPVTDARSGSPDAKAADTVAPDSRVADSTPQATDSTPLSADSPPDTTPASASPNGQTPGALGSTAPAGLAAAAPAAPTSTASPGTSGPAAAGTQSSPSTPTAGTAAGPTPHASSPAAPSTPGSTTTPGSAATGSSTPNSSPSAQPTQQGQPESGRTSRPDGGTPLDAKPDGSRPPVSPAPSRAGVVDTATTSPFAAAPQAVSTGIAVDPAGPSTATDSMPEAALVAPVVMIAATTGAPRTSPRMPWDGRDIGQRGAASPVGEFHGDARPAGQPDLDIAQLLTAISENLLLITPETVSWNRDGGHFVLADGRRIHLTIAPTTNGAVAQFGPASHGDDYEVRVSPRARTSDVPRALAHELSEIALSLDPDIDIDPVTETPTTMTTHLGGRFAELRVLLSQIDRATFDPARAAELPLLRRDLADLSAHLGLDDTAGGRVRELLHGHDPHLAQRFDLEQDNPFAARPSIGPDADLSADTASYDAQLAEHLDGEHADSLRRMENAGLQGRIREELARRIFDPLFTGADAKAARATVPTKSLLSALDPINAALNDTTTTEAQRARAVAAAIDGFRDAMPQAFRDALGDNGFQRMYDAASDLASHPRRITAELEQNAGTVTVDGRRLSFDDFLREVDNANRGATALGVDVEYTVVVHDPVDGRSAVEILPRPRPQHRLPLPQNVFGEDDHRIEHRTRPAASATAAGAHTIDVGVGRSAFGVEMTPAADRAAGGLIIKTELASEFPVAAQRRRDRGILDPGPLTAPGTVMVFGDLLFNGGALVHGGAGTVGRIFVNNVSAHFTASQYDALAAQLVRSLAPGARIELQWDTKPESETGYVNDRGHIDGDQLFAALQRQFPDSDVPFRVEERSEFPPPGNSDYDYTIDAGGSNVLNRAKMAEFSAPRPDHRMVIVYEPAGTGVPSEHRGAASAVGDFHGHARPDDQPDLTDPQLHTEIDNNLDLIDPLHEIRTAEPGHYVLPDGTPIRVRVAPTADNAVATFERTDNGYDVLVSPRARTEDIPRAIAHEVAELMLAQQPSIDIDPLSERPTTMTAHLGGRFAELRVLLTQIERAAADPAFENRLPGLRHDLADLSDRLGLSGPERSAAADMLLTRFDSALAERLHTEIPSDPVTPDLIEQVHGIPKRNQEILWNYARRHNLVLFVRPTNPDAVRHLLRGAVPKPMAIKDKTVNDLDIALGAKDWSKGLVGRFPPGFLRMPDTTGMEQSEIDALRNRLATREQDYERYAQAMDLYAEKGRFRTTGDGVVEAFVDGRFRPITGDHDLFDIRRPSGDPLTPEELARHEKALIDLGAGVQHGPHAYWDPPDTYQRVRNFESIIASHQPDLDPQTKNEPLIVFAPDADRPGMSFADRTPAAIDRVMTPWHVRSALDSVRGDTAALRDRVDELAHRPDFDHRDYQTWIGPGARVPIAIDIDGDLVPFMAIARGPDADPALVRTGTPAHELATIRRNAQPDSTPAQIVQAVTDARTAPRNLPQARDTAHALEMARDLLSREDGGFDHDPAARAALIEELTRDTDTFDPAALRAWSGDGARVAIVVDAGHRPVVRMAIVGPDGDIGFHDIGTPAHLLSILQESENTDVPLNREHLGAIAANRYPRAYLPAARDPEHAIELARYILGLNEPHDHMAVPIDPGPKVIADLSNHPDGVTRDADGLITHIGNRPIQEVVDAIAHDRADKFSAARATPAGESGAQATARVKRWQDKGIHVNHKSHGKVSAVVADLRTGVVFEGFNGRNTDTLTMDDTHPTIEHNVDAMRRLGQLMPDGGYPRLDRRGNPEGGSVTRPYPHFDSPYGHAEVKAANEALWARAALGYDDSPAAMAELYSQTYSLVPEKDADGNPLPLTPKPYCANCHGAMGSATNHSGRYPRYPHEDDEITGAYTPSPAHTGQDPQPVGSDADAPARTTRHPVGDPALQRHPVEDPEPEEEEEEERR